MSVYLSSLLVAHLSDAPWRRLVVTGDSARIQDETAENFAWFFDMLGVEHQTVIFVYVYIIPSKTLLVNKGWVFFFVVIVVVVTCNWYLLDLLLFSLNTLWKISHFDFSLTNSLTHAVVDLAVYYMYYGLTDRSTRVGIQHIHLCNVHLLNTLLFACYTLSQTIPGFYSNIAEFKVVKITQIYFHRLTYSHTSPVSSTSPLKTLWEKEKLLVTSNFSFFLGVFHPFR